VCYAHLPGGSTENEERSRTLPFRQSDELVDQVLQEFLPTAFQLGLAEFEGVGFELLEPDLALLARRTRCRN